MKIRNEWLYTVKKKTKKKHTLIADTITGNLVVYIVGYKANKYYK